MLHAVEAPFVKMALVAAAAVVPAALFVAPSDGPPPRAQCVRLELHAPEEPGALYLTQWSEGDIYFKRRGAPRQITFTRRAFINDGCEWLATETLRPDGPSRYSYRYDETILSCEPGATPARKTPRTGYVNVFPTR